VNLRATFVTSAAIAASVKPGDQDANAVAFASSMRATIAAVNAYARRRSNRHRRALNVPAALGPSGWVYGTQPLKAGMPFRFETAAYVINGQVTSMKTPVPDQPR
jgi:hypothetical protein